MSWEKPVFEEIKMDAEIGSYQEDTDPERGELVVALVLEPELAAAE